MKVKSTLSHSNTDHTLTKSVIEHFSVPPITEMLNTHSISHTKPEPSFFARMNNRVHRKIKKYLVKQRQREFAIMKQTSFADQRTEPCVRACEIALKDPENTLLVAPTSDARYIQTPNSQVFIIIKNDSVIMSNHTYYYMISISKEMEKHLIDRFDRRVESRRRQMEKIMLQNTRSVLESAVISMEKDMIENLEKKSLTE